MRFFIPIFLLTLSLLGCQDKLTIVVYADQYLTDYANDVVDTFSEEHPEYKVDLKLMSSEFIASNVEFDQPVDLALMTIGGNEKIDAVLEQQGSYIPLAKDGIVHVRTDPNIIQEAFSGEFSVVKAARGTPLRYYTQLCIAELDGESAEDELVIAEFEHQMRNYLEKGWANSGYTFRSHALGLKNVQIISACEELGISHVIYLPGNGRNVEGGDLLRDFLKSEKGNIILEQNTLIP